jgi:hypothetical protein
MKDSEMILDLLRDRFDGIERRLDQQRSAIEQSADAYIQLSNHVIKKAAEQDGRLDRVEEWIESPASKRERWKALAHGAVGGFVGLTGGAFVLTLFNIHAG